MKLSKLFCRGLTLAVGFLWMLSLDSCTIYKDPYLAKYDDVARQHELDELIARGHAAALPTPAPSTPTVVETPKIRIEACNRFVLPPNGQIPRLTSQQIDQIAVAKTVDELRAANYLYLEELEKIYKYTAAEENALNAANAKHLRSCRRVTVEK